MKTEPKKTNSSSMSPEKKLYEIPVSGSLGLLAAGDKGLRAWRKVRSKKNDKSTK